MDNAIIQLGDIDDSGKAKKFKSRFIQAGIAGYPGTFGNVLVKKETLDKYINSMVGVPVIINHKDVTVDNADELRVGVVSDVYFNEKDGWYWCNGVIWNETAQDLIKDKGWSVSCSYDALECNDEGGSENNIKYDREFTKMNFTHLALVSNPRYERANIVFNSKDKKEFVTVGEGESAHAIPVDYLKKDKKEKKSDIEKESKTKNKYHDFLKSKINDNWYKNAKLDYGVEGKLLNTSLKDDTLTITWEEKEPNEEKKTYKMNIPYASEYTNEQLYNIWSEQSYEPIEIKPKKNNIPQETKQLRLFNSLSKLIKTYEPTKADLPILRGLVEVLNGLGE